MTLLGWMVKGLTITMCLDHIDGGFWRFQQNDSKVMMDEARDELWKSLNEVWMGYG
jgi:hypothetical protein